MVRQTRRERRSQQHEQRLPHNERRSNQHERRSQQQTQLVEQLRARTNPELHEERLDLIYLPPADLGGVPAFDPGHGAPRREPTNGHSPVPPPSAPGPVPVAPGLQGGSTGR